MKVEEEGEEGEEERVQHFYFFLFFFNEFSSSHLVFCFLLSEMSQNKSCFFFE